MKQLIQKFIREEDGASAVEYGLLVALIAVALIGAMSYLSSGIKTTLNGAADKMTGS